MAKEICWQNTITLRWRGKRKHPRLHVEWNASLLPLLLVTRICSAGRRCCHQVKDVAVASTSVHALTVAKVVLNLRFQVVFILRGSVAVVG